jgi:multidrug transporter EmrE-like cation transporter
MALVMAASLVGSFGAVFLKAGSGKLSQGLRYLILNYRLAAGVVLYLGSSVFYVLGLKRGELSVLYPMVSLGYVWTLFWSRVWFGEAITRNKIVGLALILVGITLVGLGAR